MSKKSRAFCFTKNNPDDTVFNDYENYNVQFCVYQLEKAPTTETLHLQGFVYFKNPRTIRGIVQRIPFFNKCHIEIARGTVQQNIEYVTKEDTQQSEPVFLGEPPQQQGSRTDLQELITYIDETKKVSYDEIVIKFPLIAATKRNYVKDLIALKFKKEAKQYYKDLVNEQTVPKIVKVYYGEPGSGKTSRVFKKYDIDDIYVISLGDGSNSNTLWFDDYQGEPILLLDDFYGNIKYNFLLRMLDIYPLRVQCKGSYTHVNFRRIYITSNVRPSEWYRKDISALKRRITKIKQVHWQASATITSPTFESFKEN